MGLDRPGFNERPERRFGYPDVSSDPGEAQAYTGGLRGSPIAGKRTAAAPVSNPPPRRRRANPRRPVPTGEKQHR